MSGNTSRLPYTNKPLFRIHPIVQAGLQQQPIHSGTIFAPIGLAYPGPAAPQQPQWVTQMPVTGYPTGSTDPSISTAAMPSLPAPGPSSSTHGFGISAEPRSDRDRLNSPDLEFPGFKKSQTADFEGVLRDGLVEAGNKLFEFCLFKRASIVSFLSGPERDVRYLNAKLSYKEVMERTYAQEGRHSPSFAIPKFNEHAYQLMSSRLEVHAEGLMEQIRPEVVKLLQILDISEKAKQAGLNVASVIKTHVASLHISKDNVQDFVALTKEALRVEDPVPLLDDDWVTYLWPAIWDDDAVGQVMGKLLLGSKVSIGHQSADIIDDEAILNAMCVVLYGFSIGITEWKSGTFKRYSFATNRRLCQDHATKIRALFVAALKNPRTGTGLKEKAKKLWTWCQATFLQGIYSTPPAPENEQDPPIASFTEIYGPERFDPFSIIPILNRLAAERQSSLRTSVQTDMSMFALDSDPGLSSDNYASSAPTSEESARDLDSDIFRTSPPGCIDPHIFDSAVQVAAAALRRRMNEDKNRSSDYRKRMRQAIEARLSSHEEAGFYSIAKFLADTNPEELRTPMPPAQGAELDTEDPPLDQPADTAQNMGTDTSGRPNTLRLSDIVAEDYLRGSSQSPQH